MSDTPITDKACGWPVGHHGRIDSSDLKLSPDGPFVHSSVARELERENAALARWIVYHSDYTSGDHACAECYPHGEAIKLGFRCAVHVARSIDAARKEAQP